MAAEVVRLRAPRAPVELGDEAIAAACSTGDPAAVAQLFDRFQAPVARFLSRMVGASPDVEDLVQATFLEIARGGARFDGRSSVRTWVFGIAANVARHHLRTMARRGRLSRALKLVATYAAPPAEPGDVTDARQRLDRVGRALAALSIEQREAFVMCELEGMSAKEVAAAVGASEAAVWKRVSKARAALRRAANLSERS